MELVERARRAVLAFFNASPHDWVVIFTANATQALKLVGESYPFGPGGEYLLTFDNHNSVNGIREFARAKGSTTTYVPIVLPEMRVDDEELMRTISNGRGREPQTCSPTLPNRISRVCSIRLTGLRSRTARVGTFSWMRRPSRRRIGSI